MRRLAARVLLISLALLLSALLPSALVPQTPPTSLDSVLQAITAAAPAIHSVRAKAAVTDYTALLGSGDHSSGMFYFERGENGPMYELNLTDPKAAARRVVFRDQAAYVYTPASHEVVEYPLNGKQNQMDQYLTLGVGATGADLTRSFQVTLDGPGGEIDKHPTVKITLTPRAPGPYTSFEFWYDTTTWVALQQKFNQPGGDYHLVTYSDLKLNPKLGSGNFQTRVAGASFRVDNH